MTLSQQGLFSSGFSHSRFSPIAFSGRQLILAMLLLFLLGACGGGAGDDDVADADAVDTGNSVTNGDWSVEISRATERAKIIGEGNLVYQSEQGVYLIVFIKVMNGSGTLQVVPRDLFKLTDGSGTEYKPTKSAIQVAYIQHKGKEDGLDIVLDSPMKDGEEREGVVVFEVSSDGSDYSLNVKDATESLATGY
ncbi:MAG: DUF4352 domain-containing protein [Chloroflexota bacterium]